ncbi:Deoxyribose-phosphate aldolase 1 [Sporanaerobacter sp. PP17-6a]|nr:deoxyribose-phosphate aldolase [Sporanaerobacter sp. PP17-6a]SCL84729.1 Deoxyribose-phosphate aldolase 1 [Sporanaerobacter sp. PP17-6a]
MMDIARFIDHTLLKPDATEEMIENLCNEAKKYNFYAVCINPYYVKLAKNILRNSNVKIATVIGFPLGANTGKIKALEAEESIKDGADELDMVISIAALKNKDYDKVKEDIEEVVKKAKGNALVKVIIETCLLTEDEKVRACNLSLEAGANFVKTSTGFNGKGATVEDIRLIKSVVGDKMKIKASGGIRDYETAIKMIEAGANRIGASSSVKIVQDSIK